MAQHERLENNEIKLTVTVPAETFTEALTKAYIKEGNRYSVPGFRKGKAPRRMIENAYGEGVFYEGAFDACYYPAYAAALKEEGLEPVDSPKIDILQIGHGQDLIFTATFPVAPEVEVTPELYKGIELEKREYTVTDEQVNAAVAREQEKNARFVDVDRPVALGDRIVLDYAGTVDGVAFEGGTAEDADLEIGSGTFIPGFEDQLVGVAAGEEKDVVVTFPENYHAAELSGKEAVFHCKVKQVKVKELPEADDEFAKDISEFDTIEEFKEDLRKKMQADADNRARNALENDAVNAVAKKIEVDIPEAMIERQVDEMIYNLQNQMMRQGFSLEMYIKAMGMDVEKFREGYKPSAKERVKGDLVLRAIAKAENIEVTDEEVKKEIEDYAKSMNMEPEQIEEIVKGVNMEELKSDMALRKAIDVIINNAVMVDPKPVELSKEENNAAEDAKDEAGE
ncbi:MAG: trigger factor [Christensenellales bacterium]|jgi:trigger factor